MCIATGLLAWMLGETGSLRWLMFGVSCTCATFLFALVGVLFYVNHKILSQAEYHKEKKLYMVIAGIYFCGWTLFPVVWLLGFEGLGILNEDFLCVAHVLLDLMCKDVTEVLICWVTYRFNQRLVKMSQKRVTGGHMTAIEQSYANIMHSRIPMNVSMLEHMERDNTDGLTSQYILPSMSNIMGAPSNTASRKAVYGSEKVQNHAPRHTEKIREEKTLTPEEATRQKEAQKQLLSRLKH